MDDQKALQKETLETLADYNDKILHNIPILVKELSGARLEDTTAFEKGVIDAINWEIQAVNGTLSMLNEGKQRVDVEIFNAKVTEIADAVNTKDDARLAAAFEALVPDLEALGAAAREVTSNA